MGGDPTGRELHTDGRHLLLPHPHARVLRVVPAHDPVVPEHPDDDTFQLAEVSVGVVILQAQDRVTYDLAGTVEGCVPSPIAPEHLCPERAQVLLTGSQVRRVLCRTTHRVDRRMLAQHEGVRYLV